MKNFSMGYFIVIILFLISAPTAAYAQENPKLQEDPKIETQRLMNLYKKLDGTYQLQIIDSREKSELQLSLLDKVEAMRHKTDTVYFWLGTNKRMMILPSSVIDKTDFKAIENMAHISLIAK
jgi:hypothetical protein